MSTLERETRTTTTLELTVVEGLTVPPQADRIVAMEGMVRQNAGASLGEPVRLRRVPAQSAISAALVPIGVAAALNEAELRHLARSLRGLPVTAGDLVRAPGLGFTAREFQVLATNPASAVILEAGTSLRIQPPGSVTASRSSVVTYEDIGGLGRELRHVRELIELPLKHPELFDRLGIDAPKGVLLFGPPGTGKTLIARAVASESSAHFFSVSGPEVIDKFYGESEAHLRRVFAEAQKNAPSVVFLDEIDAIAPKRSEVWGEVEKRVVGQLLTLMDGLSARGQVVVVGATNRPDALDPALRRPGRFDREVSLHAPDAAGRIEILRIHSRDMPLAHDVELGELSRITPGFVGADLAALCRESAMSALRRTFPQAALSSASIPTDELLTLTVHARRDHRVAAAPPRHLRRDGPGADARRAAQRAAGHRQDAAGARAGDGLRRQSHRGEGPGAALEVGRRIRTGCARDLLTRQAGGAVRALPG